MSENPGTQQPDDGKENNRDQWGAMLRAILGEEAAQEIERQMNSSGMDLSASMNNAISPENFHVVAARVNEMLGSAGDGPINWKVGEQVARETIAREQPTTLTMASAERARTSLQTANLWLDPATSINPCTGPNQAWSPLDWLAHTLPTFRRLTTPVGENIARAFAQALEDQLSYAPAELAAVFGAKPLGMFKGLISSLLGVQYGVALAALAKITFGSSDCGLPLVEGKTAALVPTTIAAFADGLESEEREVELFVAVREQAAARLYSQVPWLRAQVLDIVAEYASDIQIDTESIENQVREMGFDPGNMESIDLSDIFFPESTPTQRATIERLEHLLALVEGWVSAVAIQATIAQLPSVMPLSEMFQRRAATSSPINETFGPLVGLHLQPRRIREATTFWQMAFARLGIEGRDALWAHPDLLPRPETLEKPQDFFEGKNSSVAEELDAFLAELLDSSGEVNEGTGNSISDMYGGGNPHRGRSDSNHDIPHEPGIDEE